MNRDDHYHITFVILPYHVYNQNPQLETVMICVERMVRVSDVKYDAANDRAIIKTVMQNKEISLMHEFLAENGITRSALLYLDNNVLKTVYCNLEGTAFSCHEIEDYIKEREDLK